MLSQFRKILRHTVLAGLAGLGLCGTGHAALVVGVFDPDFGGPLAGTNYSGSATFSISQSCLDLNLPSIGLFIPAFLPCGSGGSGMEFLGAHVNFTGLQNGTVDFAASTGDILGMYVKDHQVIGVWSKVIGPTLSTLPGSQYFDLLFGPLFPPPASIFAPFPDAFIDALQTTSLFLVSGGCTPGGRNPCIQSNPAATAFAVPEPGSMALVLSALGIACIAGTRRRSSRTSSRLAS